MKKGGGVFLFFSFSILERKIIIFILWEWGESPPHIPLPPHRHVRGLLEWRHIASSLVTSPMSFFVYKGRPPFGGLTCIHDWMSDLIELSRCTLGCLSKCGVRNKFVESGQFIFLIFFNAHLFLFKSCSRPASPGTRKQLQQSLVVSFSMIQSSGITR